MKKMKRSLAAFSPALHSSIRHLNLIRTLLFSTSVSSPSSPSEFLPSYLVTKCGFSPEKAAKAAELIPRRVLSPDQPDSVISFFKSHGFNDSHLKRVFSVYPPALASSVEKNLVPKFHTFHELGFKGDDLITLVCSDPRVLKASMENQVVPGIKLWRSLLGSHNLLMKCLKGAHWHVITNNLQKTSKNISLLRECGLSDHQISMIVSLKPSLVTQKPESLNELIAHVVRLGLPRGSSNFHWALSALAKVSEENLRAKLEFFKQFGWSEDDFSKAFCNSPTFIALSLKNLEEKMEFLVKEAGCLASYIALNPVLLMYSMEKRLIPRLKILKALKEKGLSGGDHKLSTLAQCTKKELFEKYVAPYEEQIPELSELLSASS